MDKILYILALACFVMDAFGLQINVKLFSLGVAFLVATLVI